MKRHLLIIALCLLLGAVVKIDQAPSPRAVRQSPMSRCSSGGKVESD